MTIDNLIKLRGVIPDSVLQILPPALDKYGVNNTFRVPHFLGQVAYESSNFTRKTESLYYKTASRIVEVWPTRFNLTGLDGKRNANDYVMNEEKLSNAVYDGRMGNTNPGDGYKFRGGGFLQLTGKDAYRGYAQYINKSLEETAHLLRTNDYYALDCSLWEFAVVMKLNPIADTGMGDDVIKKITRRINGGYNGLSDRIRKVRMFDDLT